MRLPVATLFLATALLTTVAFPVQNACTPLQHLGQILLRQVWNLKRPPAAPEILREPSRDGFPAILDLKAPPARITVHEHGIVRANGVTVTGGGEQLDFARFVLGKDPEPIALLRNVRDNLRLSDEELERLRPASMLSIGEGFGPLVPGLAARGHIIRGLDSWYHSDDIPAEAGALGSSMYWFNLVNRPYLIAGSALRLPVAARSLDVVLARRLLNNLTRQENRRALDEMIRVLRVGGEARIYGTRLSAGQVRRYLKRRFGKQVTLEIVEDPSPAQLGETPAPQFHTYYRIVKVAP
jgi:hypothetical protein